MHIYLRHPDHGTKVAISDVEADDDEKNGWFRFDVDKRDKPNDNQPSNDLETRRRRKQSS
jgi:hypothetical protein